MRPRAPTRSAGRSRAGRPGCGRRGSAAPSPGSPRRSATRARERVAARRPDVDAPAVDLVGDAQADRLDAGQDVELVEDDGGVRVHGDGVAQRHGVEPADPARPAGDGPELAAALGDALADVVEQLGGERPGAHPRGVGLHHADDLVDLERPDARRRCTRRPRPGWTRSRTGSCRGRGRAACPGRPRAGRGRRAGARPGRATWCRRGAAPGARPRRPPARRARRRSKPAAPIASSSRFLSGSARPIRSRSTSRSHRSSIRSPSRQARSPYAGPMPRPVVPTFAPPRRTSLARSRATWYGMITCALRLTRTRDDVDALAPPACRARR